MMLKTQLQQANTRLKSISTAQDKRHNTLKAQRKTKHNYYEFCLCVFISSFVNPSDTQ